MLAHGAHGFATGFERGNDCIVQPALYPVGCRSRTAFTRAMSNLTCSWVHRTDVHVRRLKGSAVPMERHRPQRNWGPRIREGTYQGMRLATLENERIRVDVLTGTLQGWWRSPQTDSESPTDCPVRSACDGTPCNGAGGGCVSRPARPRMVGSRNRGLHGRERPRRNMAEFSGGVPPV